MADSKRSAEKESFWRLALEEHRRSGLTIRAFCSREGISEPSFYGWRRVISKRNEKQVSKHIRQRQSLIPVDIVAASDNTRSPSDKIPVPRLEVVTPSGFTVRFHPDIEPRQLRGLLGAIVDCQQGLTPC
jgi:hypothetical protein